MNELEVPVPESDIVNTVEQAFMFKEKVGYPLIVRPAFTMGGTGGGICHNDDEAEEIAMDIVKENSSECFISDERTHIDFEEYDSVGITDKDAHYEAFEPDPYEDII